MRILVSDAVLADRAQWPDFESLLDRARFNRCYVDAANPASVSANLWLQQVDPGRQAIWSSMTGWAARDAALFRMRTMVADPHPNPAARPYPRISLRDAIGLVDQPDVLWVENDRNDRRFLLSMMPAEQRAMFHAWEANGNFRFDSRGGLGELRVALEELTARGTLDPRKNRALFDSDGEVPGDMSRDAADMMAFCQRTNLDAHCLQRRAIENYIPQKALWGWANSGGRDGNERRDKLRAFYRMNAGQRDHFRMKRGWENQMSAQVTAHFANVPAADRVTLANGIDNDIASVYETFMNSIFEWASNEGIEPDLQAMINNLTDWLRVPYA